jgi:phage terminase large subunit-like protein
MELTPGDVTDYAYILKTLQWIAEFFDLQEVGYDPYNARQFALQLQDEDGLPMVEFRQGWMTMNEPCKKVEALVHSHQLRHNGNPVMRWMASNVAVKANPDNNIRFDKAKSGDKIDGMVALAMGVGCSLTGAKEVESVYDKRGVLRL